MNVKYTESLETRVEKLGKGKTIVVEIDFFEHLLACMANQKYLPTLGASNHMSEREKEHQKIIDTAYRKAIELLSPLQGE